MSRRRFELILKHLKFITKESPRFKNPFHEISQLIEDWNKHNHNILAPILAKELLEYAYALNRGGRAKRKRDSSVCASLCGVETAPPHASSWSGTEWQFLSS
jgi:hypothetical protein